MPESEMSLGELARNQTAMERRITDALNQVNRRLDSQAYVSRETYSVQVEALTKRIGELEESRKWLARTLALAFFVSFLAPVLTAAVISR